MSRSNIELPKDMLQIYFLDDSPCYDIKVTADSVDKVIIEGGFLKIHDVTYNTWNCYNLNDISHFHYPDYVTVGAQRIKRGTEHGRRKVDC